MSEQFVDDMVYSPKMSEGGINAYYLDDCATVGHRPNYAICIHKANALKRDGTLRGSECETAIQHKTCKALALRKEELEKDRAIYFIHRDKLQAFNEERDRKAKPIVSSRSKQPTPSVVKHEAEREAPKKFDAPKKEAHFLDVSAGGYADAINAAVADSMKIEEPVAQPPAEEKPVAPPAEQRSVIDRVMRVEAGMSLVEIARMRLTAAKQPVIQPQEG